MKTKANQVRAVLSALLLTAVCTTAQAGIIYVDDDAAGVNNGSSWVDAFTGLQDALAMAQAGDEIRVAQGVYTPTQDPLDRDATFQLKDRVSVMGGYAGLAGMYPDFRHTKFFATILSGDIDHNDSGTDPNSREGNSHHVVTCAGKGNAAVLDGVTITRGHASGGRGHSNVGLGEGAGLYCELGCSPQLTNCVFTDNYALGGGAVAMRNTYGLTDEDVSDKSKWRPVFTRCTFADNHAGTGGAVSDGRGWRPEFINCLFEDNDVRGHGGAIYSFLRSSLSLRQCVFRRNTARGRGGAIYTDIIGLETQLINCLFIANTAGDTGGAIACPDYNNGNGDSVLDLVNCTFYGNTSPTFYRPPTNAAKQPDGSREYMSGSIITNCIFYNEPSEMAVSIKFGYREPLIITSIYEREQQSGQPRIVPPPPEVLFADPYGADGILGTEDDDFRLASGSPAIDSGTNEIEPPLPPMDLDGNPRILNGIVDLGAYEFTG
jgi:predicted outer membrane repeat protein